MNRAATGKAPSVSVADKWSSALADYAPLPGIPDELLGPDGTPKPHWRALFDTLADFDIERGHAVAERHIRDLGVSYRVRDEARERSWPVSGFPLLIEEQDWAAISAGIIQRAEIFERLLADV